MFKKKIIFCFIFILGVCLTTAFSLSFAGEISKPTCGKTVEECEKSWEDLQNKIAKLQTDNSNSARAISIYKNLLTEANERLSGVTINQK